MALTNADLQAISALLDTKLDAKLQPINERIGTLESRFDKLESKVDMLALKQDMTHKKLNDLSLDVKISERDTRSDIKHLQDTTETLVVVLQANNMLPKVQ